MRSYYDAHMDVVTPLPVFNLYNTAWPIFTDYGPQPPAKLTRGGDGGLPVSEDALLSPGVVVSGGQVRRSVLSPAVRVEQGAVVEGSVLMNSVRVGAGAVVRNAILDKEVVVPPGAEIGVDQELDAKRGFMVEDGLTVLGKGQPFLDA
jgi:glucose-1-phosphate adenylyltransferase